MTNNGKINKKKTPNNQKHFNIFIIKIFTYKMAYKHYLQNSRQLCLLRLRGRDQLMSCGKNVQFLLSIRRL